MEGKGQCPERVSGQKKGNEDGITHILQSGWLKPSLSCEERDSDKREGKEVTADNSQDQGNSGGGKGERFGTGAEGHVKIAFLVPFWILRND